MLLEIQSAVFDEQNMAGNFLRRCSEVRKMRSNIGK